MININNVVLAGRLTKDPELKKTTQGTSVCQFTLAVDRSFAKEDGSKQADFINCTTWRQSADYLCQYAQKGTLIAAEGRIQTRNYDGPNGKVYVTEVMVNHLSMVTTNRNETQTQEPAENCQPESDAGELIINEDDLPFY